MKKAVLILFIPVLLIAVSILGLGLALKAMMDEACLSSATDTGGTIDVNLNIAPYEGVRLDTRGVTVKGVPVTSHQAKMIQTIVGVGIKRGVPKFGLQVAIATATQESTITNISGGDRDSAGLFQQRPSMGWGTWDQVTDPVYAANKFYSVLVTVENWQNRPLTDVAQAVQRSGYPYAYQQWETESARTLEKVSVQDSGGKTSQVAGNDASQVSFSGDSEVSDIDCEQAGGITATPQSIEQAIEVAVETASDPSVEYMLGATGPEAFDCSSFLQYAFGEAGIELPRTSRQQWEFDGGTKLDADDKLKRGDLVFWAEGGDVTASDNDIYHVGLYLGKVKGEDGPQLVDAANPRSGVDMRDMYYGKDYVGALRLTVAADDSEPTTGWTSPLPKKSYYYNNSYGYRTHPVYGTPDFHNGDDLSAACGTPIFAIANGIVRRSEYAGAWGNMTVIQHGGTYSLSAHMIRSPLVKAGTTVSKGEVIGYVGSTGASTGCHLHFTVGTSMEILSGNEAGSTNPLTFMQARGVWMLMGN